MFNDCSLLRVYLLTGLIDLSERIEDFGENRSVLRYFPVEYRESFYDHHPVTGATVALISNRWVNNII